MGKKIGKERAIALFFLFCCTMMNYIKKNGWAVGAIVSAVVWFMSAMFILVYQRHEMVAQFGLAFTLMVQLVFAFLWMLVVGMAMLVKD
jgi:ATP/ADP translocase